MASIHGSRRLLNDQNLRHNSKYSKTAALSPFSSNSLASVMFGPKLLSEPPPDTRAASSKWALAASRLPCRKATRPRMQLRAAVARGNENGASVAQREFANTVYGKDTPYGRPLEYAGVDRIT